MGNIFFRGGSPHEIEAMSYRGLKYWSSWHDIYTKVERSAVENSGNA